MEHINEEQFLKEYNIDEFDRPSVTADVAVFSLRLLQEDSYRHEPEGRLSLLLIRRGEYPFKGCWSLPGSFIRCGESIEDCAYRTVVDKAGLEPTMMTSVGVYSAPDRDPRGWIISNSFLSITALKDSGSEERWFDVSLSDDLLTLESDGLVLEIPLEKRFARFGRVEYEVKGEGLAFDHAAIIAGAVDRLRQRAEKFDGIFEFLPETFTLSELQRVQETITGKRVTPANFRRKITPYVVETDEYTSGAGHRPAKLFRRNVQEEMT